MRAEGRLVTHIAAIVVSVAVKQLKTTEIEINQVMIKIETALVVQLRFEPLIYLENASAVQTAEFIRMASRT